MENFRREAKLKLCVPIFGGLDWWIWWLGGGIRGSNPPSSQSKPGRKDISFAGSPPKGHVNQGRVKNTDRPNGHPVLGKRQVISGGGISPFGTLRGQKVASPISTSLRLVWS